MKGITLFILTLLSLQSFGQVTEVDGEGRFYSRDEDTLVFIKQQLVSSAFKDVFSKEMKEMGLDTEKFWRRYEDKFTEYFLPIKEALEKQFGMDQNPNAKQTAEFNKALRKKRLDLRKRYGRLSRAIPKYSIKKMSRSPQVPNSRYIRLRAKVDRKEVNRIYLQFTADNPEKHYSTLYMTTHFNLVQATWTDTGVEIETDFTDVLRNHWREELTKSMGGKVDKVVIADSAMTTEIEGFLRMGAAVREEVVSSKAEAAKTEESSEAPTPTIGNDFGSSLWVSMNYSIKKIKENAETKKRQFEITGDLIVMDLASGKIINFADFESKLGNYSYEDPSNLRNSLATAMANIPSQDIKELEKKLMSARVGLKRVVLEVTQYANLGEIEKLTEVLGERGVTKQFSPIIESFTPNNARIVLEYAGEDKEMLNILKSLENRELEKGSKITFPNPESLFQMALVRTKLDSEESTPEESGKGEKDKS